MNKKHLKLDCYILDSSTDMNSEQMTADGAISMPSTVISDKGDI